MSRVCHFTGKKTRAGRSIARRGKAKYLGGVGRKTTGITREQEALIVATAASDPIVAPILLADPTPAAADFTDDAAEAEIGWVVDLITAVRSLRAEMNIVPATLTPLVLVAASAEMQARAQRWSDVIKRLARIDNITFADTTAG